MLKAPVFFIIFLGSRTGADRSERCLRQMGGRTPHERWLFANCQWRPARGGNQSQPIGCKLWRCFRRAIPSLLLDRPGLHSKHKVMHHLQGRFVELLQVADRFFHQLVSLCFL